MRNNLLLHVSFVLFGVAQLLPWNIYLKSVPYFRTLLESSNLSQLISSYMPTAFTFGNFFTMLILVVLRWDEHFMSTSSRVVLGMCGNALLMLLMIMAPMMAAHHYMLFLMTVGTTALAGIMTACLMKGLLGVVARFPPIVTPSLLGGQALAGLLVSTASLLTAAFKANQPANALSSAIYFIIGAMALLGALLVFLINCRKSAIFQANLQEYRSEQKQESPLPTHQPVSLDCLKRVLWRIWPLAAGISCTLAVTVSLFATFIISPRISSDKGVDAGLDYLIVLYTPLVFLLYDLGDMIGRWLPAKKLLAFHAKSKSIRLFPWLRLVLFVPAFLLIAPVNVTGKAMPRADLQSFCIWDGLYFFTAFLFGLTNGYCCTLLFMHAPMMGTACQANLLLDSGNRPPSSESSDRETAGVLMGLFLNIGLVCGSLSTFLWRALLP